MKITESYLRKLIKEEINKTLSEQPDSDFRPSASTTSMTIEAEDGVKRFYKINGPKRGRDRKGKVVEGFYVQRAPVLVAEPSTKFKVGKVTMQKFVPMGPSFRDDFVEALKGETRSIQGASIADLLLELLEDKKMIPRLDESKNSDNEIILEAHRKGRKLSPAVKKLWWLDA